MAKPGTNSDVEKRDGHTDTQTDKKRFWPPNPSPTKLGIVIEDLEHILAPLKLLRV